MTHPCTEKSAINLMHADILKIGEKVDILVEHQIRKDERKKVKTIITGMFLSVIAFITGRKL